ncbi:MAG: segregation/condensation protein A [Deltaproteobacteria bacterium]|jgi:segregation and condensation protein A|nr:segregation/condensation protein A [Deltaproteobacteria bacterium]
MQEINDSLSLKLDIYEGPLDLLLHLIKKNEVDLKDLPISLITSQYLEYLELMESLNLDIAGDFLVMAATLTQIKSRLLIPEIPGENSEEEDPRLDIVRPLMEYAAFQAAGLALGDRYLLERDVFVRGSYEDFQEDEPKEPLTTRVSLFELVDAWRSLAKKVDYEDFQLKFKLETMTIGEKLQMIRLYLLDHKSARFFDISGSKEANLEIALSFLAILELARTGFLRLYQKTETDFYGPQLFLANPDAETSDEFDYR